MLLKRAYIAAVCCVCILWHRYNSCGSYPWLKLEKRKSCCFVYLKDLYKSYGCEENKKLIQNKMDFIPVSFPLFLTILYCYYCSY